MNSLNLSKVRIWCDVFTAVFICPEAKVLLRKAIFFAVMTSATAPAIAIVNSTV